MFINIQSPVKTILYACILNELFYVIVQCMQAIQPNRGKSSFDCIIFRCCICFYQFLPFFFIFLLISFPSIRLYWPNYSRDVMQSNSSSGLEKGCVILQAPSLRWAPEDCSAVKDFICEQTRCYYYNYGSIPVSAIQG